MVSWRFRVVDPRMRFHHVPCKSPEDLLMGRFDSVQIHYAELADQFFVPRFLYMLPSLTSSFAEIWQTWLYKWHTNIHALGVLQVRHGLVLIAEARNICMPIIIFSAHVRVSACLSEVTHAIWFRCLRRPWFGASQTSTEDHLRLRNRCASF